MTGRLSDSPTDEELHDYLMENVRMSPIAWNYPDSQFAFDTHDPTYVNSLRAVGRIGGSEFLQRIVDALLAALHRLNDTPRTDPFWEGRTQNPTLHKLRDFNAHIIAKNPDDIDAIWAQAAFLILHGATNFGPKQWRRLHYNRQFDVSWPIFAALITELNADTTVEQLVELLDRLEMVEEAKAVLATFDGCEDAWILAWRDSVVTALDL